VARFRPGRRLRRALDPGDPFGEAHLRVVDAAVRVRLVVGLLAACLLLFAPDHSLGERLLVAGIVAGWAVLVAVVDAYADRYRFPTRLLDTVLGAAAVLVVTLMVPTLLTAMLLALIAAVVVDTCLAGLRGGIEALVLAIAVALIAQWQAPPGDRVSTITLILFCVFALALVVVVDTMTSERRRAAGDLERVQQALRALTSAPGLEATLESVSHSVVDVVDASFAEILLRDGDELLQAASSGARRPDDHGPVTVPLRVEGEEIGVLVARFSAPVGPDDPALALLGAYADQAALVIVRAQAYEEERLAAAELAAADRLKSEFLATVSHELRTPLTAAKGFVDTVLLHWDRLSDEQRRQMLTRASANADELARQIGKVLDLSRIEAGRVDASPEDVVLADLVGETLDRLAPLHTRHRVGVDVPDGMVVRADREATNHVLENLLSNAVKFSPPRSAVTVRARAEGAVAVVSVIDEGTGVAPEDRARIFERFEQAGAPDQPRRGAGIGLAIARSFAQLQGGDVWFEPAPGGGSVFSFSVPLRAAGALSPRQAS
jgi:two-component system sensor histidine kinase KdpD